MLKRFRHGRWWVGAGAIFLLAFSVLLTPGVASAASTPVTGGGSSFAFPEIQQWIADEPSLPVNYADSSSEVGRFSYAAGALQYGASDLPYTANDGNAETQAQTQHPFVYVPISAAGLAFAFNVEINGTPVTGLNLTQQDVCQIFTGAINNWDQLAGTPGDEALAGVNQPITVVTRSDGAGESYVLSQYCLAVDPTDWATFRTYVLGNEAAEGAAGWAGDADLAAGLPIENWPPVLEGGDAAVQENGAAADVNAVENPNNGFSIGYMAAPYAITARLPMASVENAAGDFLQPNATSVQDALAYAEANSLGTFDLNFTGSDPNAYFPATYSYVIAPTTTNAPTSAGADATLAQFLCYAVGAGQNQAASLLYAPLSQQVTAISVNAIEQIPGAPPASSCGTTTPPAQLPEFPYPALALIPPVAALGVAFWWRRRGSYAQH